MDVVNQLLTYWVNAEWYISLSIAFIVNSIVYLATSTLLYLLNKKANTNNYSLELINRSSLKKNQIFFEIKNGLIACFVFGLGSLLTRELFVGYWPISLWNTILSLLLFSAFYETYSYFIHRLLHLKPLIKVHKVHHFSVVTTPFSAYSVHPVEAGFIGLSAPLYMMFFDISLGVVFILHITGMMFTTYIHSNMRSNKTIKIFKHVEFHAYHHIKGSANFGFVNLGWDKLFSTKK